MTEVRLVIDKICERLNDVTGRRPIVLDRLPSVMNTGDIYIIAPDDGHIHITEMISSDAWQEYYIDVYAIAHVENMNRQATLGLNTAEALKLCEKLINEAFPRHDLKHNVLGAPIYGMNYGTSTWVTDTKIYSAVKLSLKFQDVLEDQPAPSN